MEVEPPAFKEYTIYWVSEAFCLVFTNALHYSVGVLLYL